MKKPMRLAWGAVLILAALLVLTVAVLPHFVRTRIIAAIETATGRKARLAAVSINPFTLTLTAKDLAIEEQGKDPLLAVGRLRASLSTSSLYRRALVLDELAIDRPTLNFARTAPNTYSFSDIIERHRAPSPEKKSGGILFSLNNITISNGSIDFRDIGISGGKTHTVRTLDVGIPFISNIPYYVESYTAPRVTAVINGTPFSLSGKVKPLSKSMETSVHLGLKRLSLPEYMVYSPVAPSFTLKSALLTVDAELSYKISADKKPSLTVTGILQLDDLEAELAKGRPLVHVPQLEVKASKLDLVAKHYHIDSVRLDKWEVFLNRDDKGEWMYAKLLPARPAPPAPQQQETRQHQKQQFLISSAVLSNGTVHLNDRFPAGGFIADLDDIDATMTGFSTTGTAADYTLSCSLDRKARLTASGNFSPAPATFSSTLALTGLEIGRSWPYLASRIAQPVQGQIDLSATLAYAAAEGLTVENGELLLKNLATRYGKDDRLFLSHLKAAGASYSQKLNRLDLRALTLSEGSVSVAREPDGTLSPASLVKPADRATTVPPAPSAPAVPAFSYAIGKLEGSGLNLSFTDRTRSGYPSFNLKKTRISMSNLAGPRFAPSGVRFSSQFGKHASLAAAGQLTPAPFSYRGTVRVKQLPLRDFEAYVPETVNVFLVGGQLDAAVKIDVSMRNGRAVGSFGGNAAVRDFYTMDTVEEQDLLKWESLQVDDVQGTLAPFALSIRQVALNNLYSRVIVRKDGTLNLQNLVARQPATGTAPTAATTLPPPAAQPGPPSSSSSPPAAPPARARIAVGEVTIQEGTLAFSDLHLPQPFSTTFYNLGGRISGLSSEDTRSADVDLRGNLENRSPLQITGRINPLREDLLVDLKISFKDIELPGVTPYSGTYLGYAVEQGKLSLDLKYLIERKQLNSENRIFIDQFNFGDKIESGKATSLPVRVAVALLKDKNGEIHLDLPVTGRTDDPQFSIWKVVWQVVRNLFAKAAASPFALLSSMAGGDSDLSSVAFAPGASSLAPIERDKLHKLSKVLAERPGIRLEVRGFVERDKDAEGYRHELLTMKMKNEKFLQLVKEKRNVAGQSADSLDITPDEFGRLLKAVYEKEKFPKPRTLIGTLKALPDSEMTKLIYANTTVGEEQLRGLAHSRCATVIRVLTEEGNLPQERIFEKLGDIHGTPKKDGTLGARVEFDIVVK